MKLKTIFKSYLKPEILTIAFLGLSSGLPIVLIISTLKALLVDKQVDIKTIGFFSMVSLPYSLKFLWAPLVDSISIPLLTKKLGRRRSWMIATQISLMIFIAAVGYYGNEIDLFHITIFAFLIGFASATQDIVVDAFRIESIKPEDMGIATSMYVYGYRIGMLISGAGALILSDRFSWDIVYYQMSLIMVIGIITSLLAKETIKLLDPKEHGFFSWFKISVIHPLTDFINRPKWYIIFLFIICFKLGDVFAGTLTLPFLMETGFSKIEIASIVKTFGLFATLFGVFLGGILVKSSGLIRSLWIAAVMQMLSNLAFYYQSLAGYDVTTLYFVIFIENFSGGIGDAVFVAYLSSLCNISFTATQYAILISFATVSRSILSSWSGYLVSYFNWENFFLASTLIAIPGLIFLFLITKSKNIEKKN